MTPENIKLVKKSWTKISLNYQATAKLFYENLFELDPLLKPLFESSNMDEQNKKFMVTLNTVVIALDKLDTIIPAIKKMGERHAGYNVKAEHYDTVIEALISTLREGLKDDFTEETKTAWIETYALVANIMKTAASEKLG